MHAAIERKSGGLKIHVPFDWEVVASIARNNPYHVYQLKDIINLRQLQEDMGVEDVKKNTDSEPVNWTKLTWMKFDKDDPDMIQYKYGYDEDAPFKRINVREKVLKKRTRLSEKQVKIFEEGYKLPMAYDDCLPRKVSKAKKKDLLDLCSDLVIPAKYHYFYENLKTTSDDEEMETDSGEELSSDED